MQVFPLVTPRALRGLATVAAAVLALGFAAFLYMALLLGTLSAFALFFDGRFAASGAIVLAFAVGTLALQYFSKRSRTEGAPRRGGSPRVCVGADGVAVHRWGSARFHPWSSIQGARRSGERVTLELVGGAEERVRVVDAGTLTALVVEGAKRSGGAPRAPRVRVFEAEGELDERWLERVRRAGAEQGYREENVGEPALIDLIDDVTQPAAQRIGAALALSHGSDDAKRRVRIAIDDTADPELGRALDEALAGELEARSLRRLTRR